IVIDAVRCAKLALDNGLKGSLIAPSSYFKKSPPVQIPDDRARELVEAYIRDPKATEKLLREKGAPTVERDARPRVRAAASVNGNGSHKTGRRKGRPAKRPARAR